jgi:hypothetical protein
MHVRQITEPQLLDALRAGVDRTRSLIARLTEYHGGPITTEYLLTGDIAREFVERNYETKVECLNRDLCNALTALDPRRCAALLRAKRTDVAIVHSLYPLALVEVKIRVRTLHKVKRDIDKITTTMALMKPAVRACVIGAVVIQVHIPGGERIMYRDQFETLVRAREQRIQSELAEYETRRPDFAFTLQSLQPEGGDGIVEGALEEDASGELAWGTHGHATQYHAIMIMSRTAPAEN